MNDERVYCNNGLLYGFAMVGFGIFLCIIVSVTYITDMYYPQEVYEVLLKYNYVLSKVQYLFLTGVAGVLVVIGIIIAWYSEK